MTAAAFIAFIKAVGDVAKTVNEIFKLYENVQKYFGDKKDEAVDQFLTLYAEIVNTRQALLAASSDILQAVQVVDARLFNQSMADRLGDVDRALISLETWRRTQSEDQRNDALTTSSGALADILQFQRTGTYTRLALLTTLLQVLPARLTILIAADAHFGKSTLAKGQVLEAARFLRAGVAELEAGLAAANQIVERVTTFQGPRPAEGPREWMVTAVFQYSNASGTVTFNRMVGPIEQESAFELVEAAQADAAAAKARGLPEDRAAARLADLTAAAEQAEKAVSDSEVLLVTRILGVNATPMARAAFGRLRQGRGIGDSAAAIWPDAESGGLDLGEIDGDDDRKLLKRVAGRFGSTAAVELWLKGPSQ